MGSRSGRKKRHLMFTQTATSAFGEICAARSTFLTMKRLIRLRSERCLM